MHKYIRHPEKDIPTRKELVAKLENQISRFTLPEKEGDLLLKLTEIDQTLELLEVDEEDPAIYAMVGGYVKEFVTYFLILYSGTKDVEKSLEAYSSVKDLTKYIVLLDKHYDEKTYDHKVRADQIFNKILKRVDGYEQQGLLHNMSTLWATATYEIRLRQRMLKEEVFDKKEIRYHILAKSSDSVLYSLIFDKYIESFNPNVMQLVHYNQAILDIQDDLNDLDEDIMRRDLNVFVMSVRDGIPLSDIFGPRSDTKLVIKTALPVIESIIDDLETCVRGIDVPNEFSFLKKLSSLYLKTLNDSIQERIL